MFVFVFIVGVFWLVRFFILHASLKRIEEDLPVPGLAHFLFLLLPDVFLASSNFLVLEL